MVLTLKKINDIIYSFIYIQYDIQIRNKYKVS